MPNPETTDLSERELDILKLVATGASNKEIAQQLFISSNTVKVHLRNIFTKIGVNSRTEAAMYAVRTGLVVHASNQPLPEEVEDGDVLKGELAAQSSAVPNTPGSSDNSSRRNLRWAPFLLLTVLIGLIFLGMRLSPGLALFTNPTASPLPLQNTPTPLPHWNHLAQLPIARSDPAVVAYSDQVYVIGGLYSQGVSDSANRYDPQNDLWTNLPPKPVPVYNVQAAVINGLIYVPGGLTNINDNHPTDILEFYDTNAGQWKTGPSLPTPLSGYCLVAFDGILYVFGGWDGQEYLNSVYAYDPSQTAWKTRTSMPTARGLCGAAEAGGKIYVIGGMNNTQSTDVNEIYSPARDTVNNNPWTVGFPIPESRNGVEAANIADTIYVFGGDEQNLNRVGLVYFPQTNIWQSLETSPFPLGNDFGMTSIGTNLFFMGGITGTTYSDQNISYQAIITLSIPLIIK